MTRACLKVGTAQVRRVRRHAAVTNLTFSLFDILMLLAYGNTAIEAWLRPKGCASRAPIETSPPQTTMTHLSPWQQIQGIEN